MPRRPNRKTTGKGKLYVNTLTEAKKEASELRRIYGYTATITKNKNKTRKYTVYYYVPYR